MDQDPAARVLVVRPRAAVGTPERDCPYNSRPARRRALSPPDPSLPAMTEIPAARTETPPLLEAIDLECFRGDRRLFTGLDLALAPGELVHVRGPNGSGKTSLLRILCGLTMPTRGTVRWSGEEMALGSPEHLSQIHYVGHASGVKLELTPRENLRVSSAIAGRRDAAGLDQALARTGLTRFGDVTVRTLSAGQRRRVALARLVTTPASLWVLDEPFTSLDADGVELVDRMLADHVAGGGAALLTSHHPLALGCGPLRTIDLA